MIIHHMKLQYRFRSHKHTTSDEWLDWGFYKFLSVEFALDTLCKRYEIKRENLKEVFPNRYQLEKKHLYEFRVLLEDGTEPDRIDWKIDLNEILK